VLRPLRPVTDLVGTAEAAAAVAPARGWRSKTCRSAVLVSDPCLDELMVSVRLCRYATVWPGFWGLRPALA
jgi:hypothetical protein